MDNTIHRCKGTAEYCGRVARWQRGDGWFCRDHAPLTAVYVLPPPPSPPPKLDYEVIGQASVRVRVRRGGLSVTPPE